ncbi:MAG: aminopeptidase P family protein, partial [Firmicutes bacterium]|nr:aminopeptidase P family protein [Bacillota bacterium]
DAENALADAGVTVAPYDALYKYLEKFTMDDTVLVSETQASHRVFAVLEGRTNVLRCRFNPTTLAKQIRNDVERVNAAIAHRRDGAALVKLLYRLDKEYKSGSVRESDRRLRTELDVSRTLSGYRAEQEGAKGDSFETIAGYGPHGAIIHYEPTGETDVPLEAKGFLLIDSGGQYLEGTTDVTRTVALGPLTDEEKTDFTLVLKGTIDLAMAMFPAGTCGYTLDILARKALWNAGLDYNHGTGHGVGHFLCVHEGPAGLRRIAGDRADQIPLAPGMVISDEPGIYRAGKHGVRIENLVTVVKAEEEGFLKFETLTCVPIDRASIRKELLSPAELAWLDGYHAWVKKVLTPLLDAPEAAWLAEATKPL